MEIKKLEVTEPTKENHFSKLDKSIPNYPGVYLLFNEDLKLIYIGQSYQIRKRLLVHTSLDNGNKTNVPIGEAKYYATIKVEDEQDRLLKELILINLLKPEYNWKSMVEY